MVFPRQTNPKSNSERESTSLLRLRARLGRLGLMVLPLWLLFTFILKRYFLSSGNAISFEPTSLSPTTKALIDSNQPTASTALRLVDPKNED